MSSRSVFRGFLSVLLILLGAAFLAYAAFGVEYEDPAARVRIIDTVIGFILGVMITPVIEFHFGSSQGSKDKADQLQLPGTNKRG